MATEIMSIGDGGLVDGNALEADETGPNGDRLVFTSEEVKQYDYRVLRNLAAYAESDCVDGKTPMLVVKSFFRCQRTLDEFE